MVIAEAGSGFCDFSLAEVSVSHCVLVHQRCLDSIAFAFWVDMEDITVAAVVAGPVSSVV